MTDLTTTQLAERLGVTKRRALDLLRSETIMGRQLVNGTWLVDSDAVARYEIYARRGSAARSMPQRRGGCFGNSPG